MKYHRLSRYKIKRIILCFAEDITASSASKILRINQNTIKSRLESELFRLLDKSPTGTDLIKIPSPFFYLWLYDVWDTRMPAFVETSQSKYFRKLQMFLLWDTLEEVWNIIGFTNIGGVIYVNRMSDVNLLRTPKIFHGGKLHQNSGFGEIFCKIFSRLW